MAKYILKRLIYMVFVFLFMSFVMFFLYNLIPGDPARAELEPLRKTLTPEAYELRYRQLRNELGLDDPLYQRYGRWIKGILTGDFGQSLQYKKDVVDVVKAPMKTTISINLITTFLSLGITIPLGIFCAVKRSSLFDKTVQVLTIVGYSLPVFIIALVVIYVFAVQLRWFPVYGMGTPNFHGTPMEEFLDKLKYLVLPVSVMTIGSLGGMTRYVRAAMVESLRMDYVRTARAKGLKERVVIYSHAWRNALLPVITLMISWFIGIFSGSIITEQMFGVNGMGKIYYTALTNQDFSLALAIQIFYMVLALVGNLIIDLSYGIVDPRVRINN